MAIPPLFQAHPWHGIPPGEEAPWEVTAFIEIVPAESVKYELDKNYGHLRIDRPQRLSSACPTLYGFIPQTYCDRDVARLCESAIDRKGIVGDGDPLDICVVTEKAIAHGGFLVRARPIGGLRMLDGNEADDKIIAVLVDDVAFGDAQDLKDLPQGLLDRIRHYFLTYKQLPEEGPRKVEIPEIYGRKGAQDVINASIADYRRSFGRKMAASRKKAAAKKR